jgi:UDP-glucose 4-epimerase
MTALLITGGAGFIGSNLAAAAARHPGVERVTVLDDLSTGSPDNLDDVDAELIVGSVTDEEAVARASDGIDAVVHLAALASVPLSVEQPLRCHEVNVTGTLRVLEAARARGIARVFVASSSAVYGDLPSPAKAERDPVRPLSPYAVSKLAAEQYLLVHQRCYGVRGVAFRFFNVYGPGQAADHVYAAAIPRFVAAALAGRPVTVFGDGRQTRDFVHVRTVCDVLLDAVVRDVTAAEPVNVAHGTETSLLELVALLGDVLGKEVAVEHQPERAGDVRHSRADDRRMRALFPGSAPVPLAEGLRSTVEWARRRQPVR